MSIFLAPARKNGCSVHRVQEFSLSKTAGAICCDPWLLADGMWNRQILLRNAKLDTWKAVESLNRVATTMSRLLGCRQRLRFFVRLGWQKSRNGFYRSSRC